MAVEEDGCRTEERMAVEEALEDETEEMAVEEALEDESLRAELFRLQEVNENSTSTPGASSSVDPLTEAVLQQMDVPREGNK